jgi:predicted transglutaminase-like cysteine proteinase
MTRHSAGCWALWLSVLLAAALPLVVAIRPPAYSLGPIYSSDANAVERISFIEDGTNAVTPQPEPPARNDEQATPLFGMDTEPLFGGDILEKWNRAKAEIAQELEAVARCRANKPCPTAAQRLMDLSAEGAGRSGRARVGLINRAVDQAISPISDEVQWGVPDHWSVKYLALLEAGIAENDVKIVVLKNFFPNENHAVVATRVDGQWLILDNRTLALVRDTDVTRAIPKFVFDHEGVKRFDWAGRNRRTAS